MVSFLDTWNLRRIPVGSRKSIGILWSPSFSHSSCIPYFPGGMVTASHLPSAPLLLTGTQETQPGLICPPLTCVHCKCVCPACCLTMFSVYSWMIYLYQVVFSNKLLVKCQNILKIRAQIFIIYNPKSADSSFSTRKWKRICRERSRRQQGNSEEKDEPVIRIGGYLFYSDGLLVAAWQLSKWITYRGSMTFMNDWHHDW